MKASEATEAIHEMLQSTVSTWPGYDPAQVPFVIYDENDVFYVNHPSPPPARPANLMAATAVEIGGVLSATVPAVLAEDAPQLVPLAYHEGFHVHQAEFAEGQAFDFFNALAHYPELDADYRALCGLETAILNNVEIEPIKRASQLSAVARRRGRLLGARSDDLVHYEHMMERNEGTASYVEQQARRAIYGVEPSPVAFNTGWSRFYSTGAAICWLLDALAVAWHEAVEAGQSLSQVLTATYAPVELPDLRPIVDAQQHEIEQIQTEIDAKIATDLNDTLTIHYAAGIQLDLRNVRVEDDNIYVGE
jgi:hypothetical protein